MSIIVHKTRKNFSLIEVSIAVGILAVGIITIMSLFPVGVKQSQDSVGANYSTICSDDIQAYLARSIENNWSTLSSLPDSKPDTSLEDTSNWGSIESDPSDPNGPKVPNIYSTPYEGIYGLAMTTGTDTDFAAQANVWTSDIAAADDINLYNGTTNSSTSQTTTLSKGINIEVSWPLNAPMANRTKVRYYFEVYDSSNIQQPLTP